MGNLQLGSKINLRELVTGIKQFFNYKYFDKWYFEN